MSRLTQRHVLVRRELDGISHAELAAELGITQQATKNLVLRARTNLVKAEAARTEDCLVVGDDLLSAHDDGRRASAVTYRHLTTCRSCRHFRVGLRDTRKAVALLIPGPLIMVALGALTGKAASSVSAKGATVKLGAATGAAVTAGAVGVGIQVFDAGDRSPQAIVSPALVQRVEAGGRLPRGTALVRASVRLPAGRADRHDVAIPCPPGLRVADQGLRVATSYAPGTVIGASSTARVRFGARTLRQPATARVSVLCKVPDARGSIVARAPGSVRGATSPRTARVEVPHARTCTSRRPDRFADRCASASPSRAPAAPATDTSAS